MRFTSSLILISLFACATALAHDDKHEGKAEHAHEQKAAVAAEPVEVTEAGKVYGAKLPVNAPQAIDIGLVADNPEPHAGKPGAFSGRITKVCQNMGCWVVLAGDNGQMARVNMHDHAFGVPKNSSGPAIVYGTLVKSANSSDEVAHLKAEGAGDAATEELKIDAMSVLIPVGK